MEERDKEKERDRERGIDDTLENRDSECRRVNPMERGRERKKQKGILVCLAFCPCAKEL